MVIIDHGQRYRCCTDSDESPPFRLDVTQEYKLHRSQARWTTGANSTLEQLCRDMIGMRTDSDPERFTANGSYLISRQEDILDAGIRPADESGADLGLAVGEKTCSFALIPIEVGQQRIGLIELESSHDNAFSEDRIESVKRLAQIFGIALSHRWLQVELRERVKELTCLYGITKLVAQPETQIEDILANTVNLLPPAWLHPESAAARITVGDQSYCTPRFDNVIQNMTSDIIIDGHKRGTIELGYIREHPPLDEGPFLREERKLIDTIAKEIAVIIEQKAAQSERQKLENQLRHTDRLATLGQLATGVAHELNEPLASILGFAQLTAKQPELNEQTVSDIQKIVSSSLHAREVIKKLLVFGRDTTPSRSETDINELIGDGLYFLQSRCTKADIRLERNLTPGLPLLVADRSQLLQVLTNLVVNAVQATPGGGCITIGTAFEGDFLQISVEDTGAGMPADILQKVFVPFFTTKSADQGTGLGLSVVHGIVTAHEGTIHIESEVDRGTTVVIRLPLHTPRRQEQA